MKVLALTILLVSVYCIEGAVVKREAEGEGQAPAPSDLQNFSQYFQNFADYFKKDALTDYATQTRDFFQQLQERILNEQLTDRIRQAFDNVMESAKSAIQ
ncbi:apolipoprotein A-II-like [Sphaerodactylus townsendi]|uniref:apolipoprotein A-II-like n=1 Tax=Sphaerodactylus townsendi TaxID=933632 RepID=UPI002026A63B|nr:apolipoprotein A-II-like [Sphaerodactylus townsendi]